MMRQAILTGLLMLGMSLQHVSAAELVLSFDYEGPAVTGFLVTQLSSLNPTAPTQFQLPALDSTSCDGVAPPVPDRTATTVCGRPPACLPPGIYSFLVQAQGETEAETSTPSNVANCEALAGCEVNCQGVTLPPALQDLVARIVDPKATPPTEADVQQVLAQITPAATTPPLPSVQAPPPTVNDLTTNPVQAVLDAMPSGAT